MADVSGYASSFPCGTADVVVGSTGGTPVLTYAAASVYHALGGVYWSYSGTPTAGSIVIADGGTAIRQWDVRVAGQGFMPFTPPLRGTGVGALSITGYPGGTANIVTLNASHWTVGTA